MSLLRSNDLRILYSDGSSLSDVSEALRSFTDDATAFSWDASDSALYIGFKHRFNHRYFKIGDQPTETNSVTFTDSGDLVGKVAHGLVAGKVVQFSAKNLTTGITLNSDYYVINPTADTFQISLTEGGAAVTLTTDGTGTMKRYPVQSSGTMTVKYWNGSAWVAFTDLIDETEGFSRSGFVVWEETSNTQINWQKEASSAITGITDYAKSPELYWVEITLGADPDEAVLIDAVKFMLSDDRMLLAVYPEIMNYLPETQSSFLIQHELARDIIVGKLKVKGLISYQEQIKNPDDWFLAATHKCIEAILDPIAGDERLIAIKKDIAGKGEHLFNTAFATVDRNKSEAVEPEEDTDSPIKNAGATVNWGSR